MSEKFLVLEQVSTASVNGGFMLDKIDLTIRRAEQWALTGPSGSGKTALARVLTGKLFHTGRMEFFGPPPRIAFVEQQHHFKNLPGTTDLYYQQRFNAYDSTRTITVEQELSEYGVDPGDLEDHLHIRPLLSRPLIQLSNGENKRVQLAIALAGDPELLILDNSFLGLDTEGRATLHGLINRLATANRQLLLIGDTKELPAAITHIARLEKGRLVSAGAVAASTPSAVKAVPPISLPDPGLPAWLPVLPAADFSYAVKMLDVTIRYGETTILNRVSWEVKRGERWSLCGPNGAGKSTLLSLITADNPQAYANELWLFDRKRGSGESIWDIKQRIGFVSPELHLYFDPVATCYEVIASGLFDTIGLFRTLSPEQEDRVSAWMQWLSITDLRSGRLRQLSTGQQRMALLARALIKNPSLLILDEPCQGLDEEQSNHFNDLIDRLCQDMGTTLIYVSHYPLEIPACVNRFLQLEKGAIRH